MRRLLGCGLCCLVVWVSVALAAKGVVNEDFEDGKSSHIGADPMRVKPQVVKEGSNHFLRITGSASDRSGLSYCSTGCPHRNRSTVTFVKEIPLSSVPSRWTYRARLRILNLHPKAAFNPWSLAVNTPAGYCAVRIQAFSSQPGGEGAGKRPNHYYLDRRWHESGSAPYSHGGVWQYDLGGYSFGQWHSFRVDAVYSKDPKVGRFDVYVDGALKRTWKGNTHPQCAWATPEIRFGFYGDYATGLLDIDDVQIYPTGSTPPPPTPPPVVVTPAPEPRPPVLVRLPPPTQLRLIVEPAPSPSP